MQDAVTTRADFARALLAVAERTDSARAVDKLVAWMHGEGTHAAYNPLATTRSWPGATDYNSAGVRNYPSVDAGLAATWLTIDLHYYAAVRDALQEWASVAEFAEAVVASPWGTHAVPATVTDEMRDHPIGTGR